MPRPNLKLGVPEVAAVIDKRHATERDPWKKNRLLAIKLAAHGEHTAEAIAGFCGIARGYLFEWIKVVRGQGLEALLQRRKRGPKEGSRRGLEETVLKELQAKLAAGEFLTAVQAQRWLEEAHGIKRPVVLVKKSGRSAVGAAPQPLQEGSRRGSGVPRQARRGT